MIHTSRTIISEWGESKADETKENIERQNNSLTNLVKTRGGRRMIALLMALRMNRPSYEWSGYP